MGGYIFCGGRTLGGATVRRFNGATVRKTVRWYDGTTVQRYNGAVVRRIYLRTLEPSDRRTFVPFFYYL